MHNTSIAIITIAIIGVCILLMAIRQRDTRAARMHRRHKAAEKRAAEHARHRKAMHKARAYRCN